VRFTPSTPKLAFLVRSFFFVPLGVRVDFSGKQKEFLASLGITGLLFVARFFAIQISRCVWRAPRLPSAKLPRC